MTDYARYNLVVTDESGNVVDGASISVQNETTLGFPQLYSTRTGTTALGNPFTATDGADAGFHVTGGAYKITATLGAFSRTWRYVAIGTVAENDIGALATTVGSVIAGWYNVKDFGATGDQVTDDTAAIQDALDTVPTGGTLYFPEGFYVVLGSGTTALSRTLGPINIFGDGCFSTGIFPGGGFPATRDFLTITPDVPGGGGEGIHIRDFSILPFGLGRDALVIDAGVTNLVFQVHIHDVRITATATTTAPGWSIHCKGNIAYSTIERCNLSCVFLEDTGDGFTIRENVIGSNVNNSIVASFTAGAGGLQVIGNVIAGRGAAVVIDNAGHASVIAFNEIETPVSQTNIYGVLIDIGVSAPVFGTRLEGNGYSVLTGTGDPIPIRVRTGCIGTQIREAKILNQGGVMIQIDSGAVGTFVDRDLWVNNGSAETHLIITDNGTRTGYQSSKSSIELLANQTGTDTASAQTWFPGGGTTSFSLLAGGATYEFDGVLMVSKTAGTTSRTIGMNFGGTAGISQISYSCEAAAIDSTVFAGATTPTFQYVETASNQTVWGTASTSANQLFCLKVRGRIIPSSAGTFIPNFQYSAAPGGAPTVRRGSHFRLWDGK